MRTRVCRGYIICRQMTGLMHACKGLTESYVDDVIHAAHGSCGGPLTSIKGAIRHFCLRTVCTRMTPRTWKYQTYVAKIITMVTLAEDLSSFPRILITQLNSSLLFQPQEI